MRRLLIYIGLSVALHIFAVWPLLAEQFAVADDAAASAVAGAQSSVLKLPTLVQQAPVTEPKPTAAIEPAVAPAVPPVPLLEPQVQAAPKPQPQPKAEVQPEPKAQAEPKPQVTPEPQAQPAPVAAPPPVAKPPVQEARKEQPQAAQPTAVAQPEQTTAAPEADAAPKHQAASAITARDAQQTQSAPAAAQPATQEVTSTQPRFARPPSPPHYPAQAKRRQQQGTVWVEVRLDRRGQLVAVQVLRSSGVSSLDQAALAAVRRWQFLPEQRGGVGVPSRVHIPIEFAIAANR